MKSVGEPGRCYPQGQRPRCENAANKKAFNRRLYLVEEGHAIDRMRPRLDIADDIHAIRGSCRFYEIVQGGYSNAQLFRRLLPRFFVFSARQRR